MSVCVSGGGHHVVYLVDKLVQYGCVMTVTHHIRDYKAVVKLIHALTAAAPLHQLTVSRIGDI